MFVHRNETSSLARCWCGNLGLPQVAHQLFGQRLQGLVFVVDAAQNTDDDWETAEILLVPKPFIDSDEQVEFLGRQQFQQRAVLAVVAVHFADRKNVVCTAKVKP